MQQTSRPATSAPLYNRHTQTLDISNPSRHHQNIRTCPTEEIRS